MWNNCRLEVHLLFAYRLVAATMHSSGNRRRASHHRPHYAVAAHCPKPSHPPRAVLRCSPSSVCHGGFVSNFYFICMPSSENVLWSSTSGIHPVLLQLYVGCREILLRLYAVRHEVLIWLYAKFYYGYELAVTVVCVTCCCWLLHVCACELMLDVLPFPP